MNNNNMSQLIGNMIESYEGMINVINDINAIMNKTKMLSLNSSIEASRAGEAGKGFSVIASEINTFSKASQDATNEGRTYMKALSDDITRVVGVRTADVAYDLMDKIDRLVYERKCDNQGWIDLEFLQEFFNDKVSNKDIITRYFGRLVEMTGMYRDIMLLDEHGNLIYSVSNNELVNKANFENEMWFKKTIKQNDCFISDMFYFTEIGEHIIINATSVKDVNNKIIGAVVSLVNWSQFMDIIKSAKIGDNSEVYLLNSNGEVLASKNEQEILERNLIESENAAREVVNGNEYGFFIEKNDDEISSISGFALSKGFMHYEGKGWSVVVKEVLN